LLRARRRHALAGLLLLAGVAFTSRIDFGLSSEVHPTASRGAFQPRFEITWFQGVLTLDGHTLSSAHEALLRLSAARGFPGHPLLTTFRPLGVAPDYWQNVTVQLVELLAATRSGAATVTGKQVTIRGVVAGAGLDEQLAALRAQLPDDVAVSDSVFLVSDPTPVPERCKHITATQKFGPIGFEEASTVFRASAYPVLDQIITLADACRAATVTITGHSDSTGDAVFNRQLSQARAQAVTDFLASRGGIAAGRLVAEGAGATHPIADNRTRYGRSLNRRIDVDFTMDTAETAE